jgi:AcrR family transcriptional regulator
MTNEEVTMPAKQMTSTRRRNPRGQGERLRDDIIEAASRLLADPAAPPLTLRAVAREVGVAATSVYLHFDSIEALTLATVNHLFAELIRRQDGLTETDPRERVLAGALVYCEFGLAAPGHYQLMFATPLPLPDYTPEHFPGWTALQQLIDRVAAGIGTDRDDPKAFFTAQLIWQQLHGIVSLRISRTKFPWPPLEQTVLTAVGSLLDAARPFKDH